jgi:hypothetical protein
VTLSDGLRAAAQRLLDKHFGYEATNDAMDLNNAMADIPAHSLSEQLRLALRQATTETRQFECRMRKDDQGNWRMTGSREWNTEKKALGEWQDVGKGFAAAASMLSAFGGGGADAHKAQLEQLRERYNALLAEKP